MKKRIVFKEKNQHPYKNKTECPFYAIFSTKIAIFFMTRRYCFMANKNKNI